MLNKILEEDWRLLRELSIVALDRYCERTLDEIARIAADSDRSYHQRYLSIYRTMEDRERQPGAIFNDLRRSTAAVQLARMRAEDLMTDDEFARFSDSARAVVRFLLGA